MSETTVKKPRPTPAQDRLIERIRKAGCLCVEHTETGDRFFLPNGRTISPDLVRRALDRGRLVPVRDGLFDDTQTYIAA